MKVHKAVTEQAQSWRPEVEMSEALLIVVLAVMALVLLDVASVWFGADSRPSIGDDHQR